MLLLETSDGALLNLDHVVLVDLGGAENNSHLGIWAYYDVLRYMDSKATPIKAIQIVGRDYFENEELYNNGAAAWDCMRSFLSIIREILQQRRSAGVMPFKEIEDLFIERYPAFLKKKE
jgi:hypothetical protein